MTRPEPSAAPKALRDAPTGGEPALTVPSGLGLMGRPLAPWRRQRAYRHARGMGLSPEEARTCVGAVAERYERDDPYGAEREALTHLCPAGHYRLMAALLADPEPDLLRVANEQEGWPLPWKGQPPDDEDREGLL